MLFLEIPYIYQVKFKAYIFLLGIILCVGCGKLDSTPEININFQDPVEVSETGFQISWSISTSDYQSLTFFLAEDPGFSKVVRSKTFEGSGANTITFKDLHGAATYYFRISLVRAPGSIFVSRTKSIEMPFQQEFISFDTPDFANLKGSLYYRDEMDSRRPAIIMMHEYGIFVNGWINSDILKLLVAEGYVCLIFSNRGHGNSTGLDDIQELLENPELLANDLRAAILFMQQNERVMADSIGLMGGSMGASMSITGNGNEAVRTSVALSPANRHIYSMYPDIPIKSVFYLVGDQDIVDTGEEVIDFPAEAAALYNLTSDPKKMLIIENNSAHGTELLESSGVKEAILEWFQQQLPVLR